MDTVFDKRIVLEHTTGPLAGLSQIVGCCSQLPVGGDYPPSLHQEGRNSAHHVWTGPRAVTYREWAQAPAGQLNDFHPVQV